MHPHRLRTALGAVIAALAIVPATATASAGTFYPNDRYDCQLYQAVSGTWLYVDSYQFLPHHRYAFGLRGQKRRGLSKTVSTGKYKRSGAKIIPLSGEMKTARYYMLIHGGGLDLMNDNGTAAVYGCYTPTKHSQTQSSGQDTGGPKFPLGHYQCYRVSDGNYGYTVHWARDLDFWSDGTYMTSYSVRMAGWKQSGSTIQFTAGSLWTTNYHDVGTWFSAPIAMPHDDADGAVFTLVVKSTRPEEVDPPMIEFNPNSPAGNDPESFDYCKYAGATT